jgi:hypothetical protein
MRRIEKGDAWFASGVSPFILFLGGLLLAPALLMQRRLDVKAVQLLFLFALAWSADPERVSRSAPGTLVFLAVTVLLNLTAPLGRVLARLGPLAVTEEALQAGLYKALTLAALIYLSRFFIRRSLVLPGALGRYIGATLQYLNRLLAIRSRIRLRHLASDLDLVLEEAYRRPLKRGVKPAGRNTPLGLAALACFLALNYSWLLPR